MSKTAPNDETAKQLESVRARLEAAELAFRASDPDCEPDRLHVLNVVVTSREMDLLLRAMIPQSASSDDEYYFMSHLIREGLEGALITLGILEEGEIETLSHTLPPRAARARAEDAWLDNRVERFLRERLGPLLEQKGGKQTSTRAQAKRKTTTRSRKASKPV